MVVIQPDIQSEEGFGVRCADFFFDGQNLSLDFSTRLHPQGGPKCLIFGSINTGYLFLNWPKFGSDHKKFKTVAFLELFFDHQIQVIYS